MSDTIQDRPNVDDLPIGEWTCEECGEVNSQLDGECQFCDGEYSIICQKCRQVVQLGESCGCGETQR